MWTLSELKLKIYIINEEKKLGKKKKMGTSWGWVSGGGGVGVGIRAVVGGWVLGGVRVGMDLGWRWGLYSGIGLGSFLDREKNRVRERKRGR